VDTKHDLTMVSDGIGFRPKRPGDDEMFAAAISAAEQAAERANPKDANGRAKLPLHLWPASATAYGAIGLLEGMLKYGRTNWRATPVFAHIYLAAAMRHLSAWFEGEDFTEEGAPHLGNALACIAILVDAQTHGTLIDDRQFDPTNGTAHAEMVKLLTECSNKLKARFGDVNPKHYDRQDMPVTKA
jgi:hypothetical protein